MAGNLRTGWMTIESIIANTSRTPELFVLPGPPRFGVRHRVPRIATREGLHSARCMTRKRPGDVLAHQRRRVLRARTQRRDHALLLGCIAESHGEIARPALVADSQDRAACHALAELALGPSEKLDELGAVQAVADPEVRLRRDLRVAVPGADELAVVAAEDAVADERPELQRNAAFQLDGQVGNAAPRIQRVRCDDRARRADVDALGAGAAMFAHRSVHRERKIRVDLAEKEKRARLAREQQRVLSPPAEPRLARQLHFHHRRRVGEHAVAEFADFAFDSSGELLQASPQHLVVIAPESIASHERLVAVGENAPAVGRIGTVVESRGNDAQRSGNERRRTRSFGAVLSHIIQLAGETPFEPGGEAGLHRRQVGIGDTDGLEPQLASPGLDRRGERRKIVRPRPPRPVHWCFHVTHSSNHSQLPREMHWTTHLPEEAATSRLRTLLRGLGVEGVVKSPSYALVELYVVSRLNLYHFDFYRFMNPSEFGDAGLADYFRDGDGVCMVEWPERAGGVLPPPDLELELAYSGTGRDINVRAFSEAGGQCLKKLRDDG